MCGTFDGPFVSCCLNLKEKNTRCVSLGFLSHSLVEMEELPGSLPSPLHDLSFRYGLRYFVFDELMAGRYYYLAMSRFTTKTSEIETEWFVVKMSEVSPEYASFYVERIFRWDEFGVNHVTLYGTRKQIDSGGQVKDFKVRTKEIPAVQYRFHFYAPKTDAIEAAAVAAAAERAPEVPEPRRSTRLKKGGGSKRRRTRRRV